MKRPIPIVDIFAGPGGLGEGFSALGRDQGEPIFETAIAAEMNQHAHKTLTLRSFFRQFPHGKAPASYYDYLAGRRAEPFTDETKGIWEVSSSKVLHLELGVKADDKKLDEKLKKTLNDREDWVLLGGPPCQAYSTIGRWKYRTDDGHDLSKDARAHLYKQYLRIIHKHCPKVFVMENVRGLLSSKYFELIIKDLKSENSKGLGYRLYSLVENGNSSSFQDLKPSDYIIRSEEHGIPQRRHRVIIVGVRTDYDNQPRLLEKINNIVSVGDAILDLPKLRSGLSKTTNTDENWQRIVAEIAKRQSGSFSKSTIMAIKKFRQSSALPPSPERIVNREFADWIKDERLISTPNHETRGHMESDLARYYFAAKFGEENKISPRDRDFPAELDPDHKSWKKNKFNDRFRVQVANNPSTTVVSHISKDGHSYIHPDPIQCRSLTVREAARLQTFPDNYFFEGPRTEQYRQVGNAVPPLLAYKIAKIVRNLFEE